MQQPYFDPTKSYEKNCLHGPFGLFATKRKKQIRSPHPSTLLGFQIDIPFGIGAGSLPNARFIRAAWDWGFSIATYKTVRSRAYPSHPFPNIVKVRAHNGEVHPRDTVIADFNMQKINVDRDGITNSFAVPSQPSSTWIADAKKATVKIPKGSVFILSFMGTKWDGYDRRDFIEDFAACCCLASQANPQILEVNLSCPNFGAEGLVCNDIKMTADILETLAKVKGNTPLVVKVGYVSIDAQNHLEKLLTLIRRYANGVVGINTISAQVVDRKGNQALPGSPVRLYSGICGSAIRWAGLDFSRRAVAYRKKNNWKDFTIIGVGGVTAPEHFDEYVEIGVDAVLSVTGSMWKPRLALDIQKRYFHT